MSQNRTLKELKVWNPFEEDQKIKRRRIFVIKLLQGILRGLAFMHDHNRLHQSLGPASVVLKYDFSLNKLVSFFVFLLSLSMPMLRLIPDFFIISTIAEREAAYLVPRLRDLAFSVDIRYSYYLAIVV